MSIISELQKLLKAKINIILEGAISTGFDILDELFPNNDIMIYKSRCYVKTNDDYVHAIMCCKGCYDMPKAIFMQGTYEYLSKDYNKAIQDLTRVVNMTEMKINAGVASPEDIVMLHRAYRTLGNIHVNKLYQTDIGIQYYEKAVEVYNDVISLINWSGVIKYKSYIDLIAQNIKSVLKIKAVYSSLSIAYSAVGDRANSEKYYELEESCK